jgi:hypothetical protein
MSNAATGPAPDDDGVNVHLFLCLENGHYAVSTNSSGANIPAAGCRSGWKYVKKLRLGVRDALPFPADPEPVVRAVHAMGYWVYDSSLPHGTSQ